MGIFNGNNITDSPYDVADNFVKIFSQHHVMLTHDASTAANRFSSPSNDFILSSTMPTTCFLLPVTEDEVISIKKSAKNKHAGGFNHTLGDLPLKYLII